MSQHYLTNLPLYVLYTLLFQLIQYPNRSCSIESYAGVFIVPRLKKEMARANPLEKTGNSFPFPYVFPPPLFQYMILNQGPPIPDLNVHILLAILLVLDIELSNF